MKKYTKAKNSIAKNQGITLIALIVTIITMLILSGVSLSILLGNNGVLNKATQAKKLYDVSAIKEALEMEKAEIGMESKRVNLDNYLEQITSGEKAYNLNSTDKIDDRNAEIIVNGEHKFLIKDKENGDVEIIYQGIAKIGDLALSSSSGTYTYPTSGTFSVINNSTGGALSVTSESPNIATVSISGNTITVTPGTTAGKAKIVVKSAAVGEYAENRAIYMATVQNGTISISATPYTGTYDGAEHDALTNVTTDPTGTTIEYSTDGVNYSSTMPKIKDTSSFTVSVSASKVGYKTQTETYTVTVNRADGDLTLSATSGTLTYPNDETFTVSGNTGALSVSSNAPNVATASLSGNTVTVTPGTTAGKATITVKSAATSNYNEKTATYEATVQNGTISVTATPYTGTYDGQVHNAVTVTTNPSDAKKEYSTDGTNYSTTVPTVTNVTSYTISVRVSKAGYKTETVTKTVTVNKAAGGLSLSATSGTITYPNTKSITASGNTGTISASSSNTNVATVGVSGNTITITPKNVNGTATITVTSAATTNYNAKSVTYSLTVKKGTYSVGESVTVGGKAFYVIGDNGTNVTLLYKSTIGTAKWADAKTQASTFGSNLGGTGRLMTKAEAEGVAASCRNIGTKYWLADAYGNYSAWYVDSSGYIDNRSAANVYGVRPVVVISKSKL